MFNVVEHGEAVKLPQSYTRIFFKSLIPLA